MLARATLALMAALCVQACAQPMGAAVAPKIGLPTSLEVVQGLPAQLASFRRASDATDYEARPGGAGLGASANYQPAQARGIATIYVYDGYNPPRTLTPGAASPEVDRQVRNALAEIEAVAASRGYRVGAAADLPTAPGPDGRPALRCLRVVLQLERGPSDSTLCVGVVSGRFLKLRVTAPAGALPDRDVQDLGAAAVAAVTR